MISFHLASDTQDLQAIVLLQKQNLPEALSEDEKITEGYVSLVHNEALLSKIRGDKQHIVAKINDVIIGYALVMLKEYADDIPALEPMFNEIHRLNKNGSEHENYVVMGQICVDKSYRGQGVFRGLYQKMKADLIEYFEEIITEVDSRNIRSLNAHLHVGFQILKKYKNGTETWVILSMSTNKN